MKKVYGKYHAWRAKECALFIWFVLRLIQLQYQDTFSGQIMVLLSTLVCIKGSKQTERDQVPTDFGHLRMYIYRYLRPIPYGFMEWSTNFITFMDKVFMLWLPLSNV